MPDTFVGSMGIDLVNQLSLQVASDTGVIAQNGPATQTLQQRATYKLAARLLKTYLSPQPVSLGPRLRE